MGQSGRRPRLAATERTGETTQDTVQGTIELTNSRTLFQNQALDQSLTFRPSPGRPSLTTAGVLLASAVIFLT